MFKINLQSLGPGISGTEEEAKATPNAGQENADATAAEAGNAKNIDPAELERIGGERAGRAERNALTSYLKQQGLSEEEAAQAFEAFKSQKSQAAEAERQNLTAMQQKVEAYERQETERLKMANFRLVRAEAMTQAVTLNVRPDRVDYALRLADLSQVEVDENGIPDAAAVREAIEKVTQDLPELLKSETAEDKAGFHVGGPGQQTAPDINDQLSKIFGNK